MLYLILFFLLLYGLLAGSFLNVVIYRLEGKKRKNLRGRSFCPSCEKQIKWHDNIPVVSWLLLHGKCRACKKTISAQYPLVELATGFTFVSLGIFFFQMGNFTTLNILNFLFWVFFASYLIAIFVYDLKHQIIPDEIIYTVLALGLLYVVLNTLIGGIDLGYLKDHLISGLVAGGFFYLFAAVSNGKWMGGGDIKMAAFMGLVLGWQGTLVALYFAFIVGAMVGAFALITKHKKLGSKIPFGPFLVLGTLVGLLFGEKIISFYVNMFM